MKPTSMSDRSWIQLSIHVAIIKNAKATVIQDTFKERKLVLRMHL